jgi:hypothetical protein
MKSSNFFSEKSLQKVLRLFAYSEKFARHPLREETFNPHVPGMRNTSQNLADFQFVIHFLALALRLRSGRAPRAGATLALGRDNLTTQ